MQLWQYFFINHCKITLNVSDAFCLHHQEYKNCSNLAVINKQYCQSCILLFLQMLVVASRCRSEVPVPHCYNEFYICR
jgi:hypothetical protein